MPENSNATGAVFLSYASQDSEAAARICESLRTAGIEVWFDQSELRGGDAWDSKIKKQIHDCALFMPVISTHTNERTEGYFRREWKLAVRRLLDIADDAAFLVPVVIDDTREAHARVPEEFLGVQWTRLPGGKAPPGFAERVRRLLGWDVSPVAITQPDAPGTTSPSPPSYAPIRRHRMPQLQRVGIILTALLLLMGGGFWWYYQGLSDAPATKPASTPELPVNASVPHERSIAVLPFVNMSSDKEQEYFSDGLSEQLLNVLAKVPELRVAARTSSFYFKGKDIKLQDIARELRVAHVLEGSVQKSGNRVRITAQLIRASDGYHRWSESYDRTLEDIFAVQEEIAAAVVKQLKITLLGAAPKVQQTSPEAYALYLQALQLHNQYTSQGFEQSIALYRQSLAIDPSYAPAWDGLAQNYMDQATWDSGARSTEESYKLAREAAHKALAIDPDYARPHVNLSRIALFYDDDLMAAVQHMEHALALEPADLHTLSEAASLSLFLGRLNTAIEVMEHIAARDPMNAFNHGMLGWSYLRAGRLDEAIASSRTSLTLTPTNATGTHFDIGVAMLHKGDHKAALAAMQEEPAEIWRLAGLALAYHALRQTSASDAALAELIKKHEKHFSSRIAWVFAYRGEADRAFEWLDKAVAYHDPDVVNFPNELLLRNLHNDPRWRPFLKKIGKAPEQLAAIKFDLKVPTY